MKAKAGKASGALAPRSAVLPLVIILQFLAFAAAGAALFLIARMEFARDFYSAHRGIGTIHNFLLPAAVTSSLLGFIAVAVITWLGFRSSSRRFAAPIERAEDVLRKLSRGHLAVLPASGRPDRKGGLEETAAEMALAYRERLMEIHRLSKDIHSGVLSLRYKSAGDEPLTRKEIQQIAGALDILCKQLNSSIKWFET